MPSNISIPRPLKLCTAHPPMLANVTMTWYLNNALRSLVSGAPLAFQNIPTHFRGFRQASYKYHYTVLANWTWWFQNSTCTKLYSEVFDDNMRFLFFGSFPGFPTTFRGVIWQTSIPSIMFSRCLCRHLATILRSFAAICAAPRCFWHLAHSLPRSPSCLPIHSCLDSSASSPFLRVY